MQPSIADEMNSMEWVSKMCGLTPHTIRQAREVQEPDEDYEICPQCGEDPIDCKCPNVNEDGEER